MKSKVKSTFVLILTAIATAAINYSIFNSDLVFLLLIILVLIAHELGHYFTAILNGAQADIPYIIPLPLIAIGITRIKNFNTLSPKVKRSILVNGPLYGVITSIILFLYLLINPIISPYLMIFVVLFEVILNYFGSDGIRYRKIGKEIS